MKEAKEAKAKAKKDAKEAARLAKLERKNSKSKKSTSDSLASPSKDDAAAAAATSATEGKKEEEATLPIRSDAGLMDAFNDAAEFKLGGDDAPAEDFDNEYTEMDEPQPISRRQTIDPSVFAEYDME